MDTALFKTNRVVFDTSPSPDKAKLKIFNVSESDDGLYRCRVDFKMSQTRTSRLNLTVVGKRNFYFILDNILWSNNSITILLYCFEHFCIRLLLKVIKREKYQDVRKNVISKYIFLLFMLLSVNMRKKNVTINGALRSRSIANWQQFCKNTPLNVCHLWSFPCYWQLILDDDAQLPISTSQQRTC